MMVKAAQRSQTSFGRKPCACKQDFLKAPSQIKTYRKQD
jgi:hypothetical protein